MTEFKITKQEKCKTCNFDPIELTKNSFDDLKFITLKITNFKKLLKFIEITKNKDFDYSILDPEIKRALLWNLEDV